MRDHAVDFDLVGFFGDVWDGSVVAVVSLGIGGGNEAGWLVGFSSLCGLNFYGRPSPVLLTN